MKGVRIVELESIGPALMAAMLLSQIDHPDRPSRCAGDLKDGADLGKLWALIEAADVLIEGDRPGVCDGSRAGPPGSAELARAELR